MTLLPVLERALAAGPPKGLILGRPQRFGFEGLRRFAKALATKPYPPEKPPAPDLVGAIDFDTNQKIKFRQNYSLWQGGSGNFPARFFHLNRYVGLPVKIHAVFGDM